MRARLRYTKLGKVRFVGHRDLARVWERALRKAGVPVAYSGGFSPRPKLSFGLALSTGHESVAEYLDVDLDTDRLPTGFDTCELPARLGPVLPPGVDVTAAAPLPAGAGSLQQEVVSSAWRLEVAGADPATVTAAVHAVLAAPALVARRQRKGREVVDDLRPAILDVAVAEGAEGAEAPEGGVVLEAELAVHPRSVRPGELLDALGASAGVELVEGRVRRTHQWIRRDGAKEGPLGEPAVPDATQRPHAGARA